MPNLLARAHKATGDMVSAVVFLRIAFRYHQAVRAGREWTAQSYEDLMNETGCSHKQVRRSVSKIRDAELVVTKRGLFANKNVLHFKLTTKGQSALEGQSKSHLQGQFEPALQGQFYIQGETTGSNNMEIIVHPNEQEIQVTTEGSEKGANMIRLPSKAKRLGMNAGAGEAKSPKAKSVKDVVSTVKANKMLHKPNTVTALEYIWKNLLHDNYGTVTTVMTLKEKGLLKNFINKCPPGTAEKTLTGVLDDWVKFAKTVEQQAGIKTTPTMPSLYFLLTHAGIAVNLVAQSKKAIKPKQEASAVAKPKQSVQLISQPNTPKTKKPDDKIKDLAHLLSIINEDT